ncbi:MAG: Ku protein [Lysobacterales bacterium]
MPRPIWNGSLSFGLLNIPISLMSGEKRTDISFRMLDGRNKSPIRYERVNAETGEEVPWKDIVKAFEYDKGSYVVIEESDLAEAASDSREMIELDAFVDRDSIAPNFLEKPYILVPGRKAEKGYVLLREVLKKSKRVGIGRVVIRTREYLAMVTPQADALLLILLRFPQELVDPSDFAIPEGSASKWKITPRELEMANSLVASMSSEWKPIEYRDEFRERLSAVIKRRIKTRGAVKKLSVAEDTHPEGAATNVVDFMALLKQSLDKRGKKGAEMEANPKKPATKSATKKSTTRKRA